MVLFGRISLTTVRQFLFLALTLPLVVFAGSDRFPEGPDSHLTPGSLCTRPTEYRYPEQIPYCERNVETDTKRAIIKEYDAKLGFQIGQMDRQQFKIDHLIPLCAGGSNEERNLWPQHVSVYEVTDPMEPLICDKMKAGVLKQKDAIEMIKRAKLDLSQVEDVISHLESL